MRYFILLIGLIMLSGTVMAAEDTLSLDRCVILNDAHDLQASSKLAVRFAIPVELSGREVHYAELRIHVPALPLGPDSLLELRVFPLLAEWQEDNIDYDNSETITDSLSAGCYTLKLGTENIYRIDFTSFVREAVWGQRSNNGLMVTAELLGDEVVWLPEDMNERIRASANIKVVYK